MHTFQNKLFFQNKRRVQHWIRIKYYLLFWPAIPDPSRAGHQPKMRRKPPADNHWDHLNFTYAPMWYFETAKVLIRI